MENTRNLRKERIGVVASNKMDKSVVVKVERKVKHPTAKLYHPDTTDGDASRNPTAAKKFKELTDAYAIICEELLECDVGEVTEDIIDAASGRGAEEADGPKAGLPGFGKTGR